MFHSARLKLTAWYLLIIFCISIIFSVIIYRVITNELNRVARLQRTRFERVLEDRQIFPSPPNFAVSPSLTDPQILVDAQHRLILSLLLVNVSILILAGGLSYLLAGITLKPIQKMVDEQSRFIADASHELRTPITALKSSIEVHLRDKKLNLKEATALLKNNLAEVNQLQTLSDALLNLTHLELPNGWHQFQKIQVTELISQTIKKVLPLAQQKNISLQSELIEAEVMGNASQLAELLTILFDNAIKYSPAKSVITVTASHTDSTVAITVTDQGAGIDATDLPYIFDRFYRADKSRSRAETVTGYGLGLSIAQQIVQHHHGSIEVSQTSATGTTFIVRLPASK